MRRLILPFIAAFFATTAAAAPVMVPVDQSRKLSFPGLAASVVVANPDIADVNVVNEHTILVVGKRRGLTNVVIMDRSGRTLFDREIMVAAADAGSAVTINRAGVASTYACAANCERISGSAGPAPAAVISGPTPAP